MGTEETDLIERDDEGEGDEGEESEGVDEGEQNTAPEKDALGRAPRKERRAERSNQWRERQTERIRAEVMRDADAKVAEVERRFQAQLAQVNSQIQGRQQEDSRSSDSSAHEKQLAALEAEAQQELKYAERLGSEWSDKRYNQIQRDMRKLEATQIAKAQIDEFRKQYEQQGRQSQQQNQGYSPVTEFSLKTEFPWLQDMDASDPATKRRGNEYYVAASNYEKYLLSIGRPEGIETKREACAHIAAEKKLGGTVPKARPGTWPGTSPGGRAGARQVSNTRIPDGEEKFLRNSHGITLKNLDVLARRASQEED